MKLSIAGLFRIIVLLLGLFLAYHITLKLLGGSLTVQDIIMSILAVFFSLWVKTANGLANASAGLARLEGKVENHQASLNELKAAFGDFKQEMRLQFRDMNTEFKDLRKEFRDLRNEFRTHSH